MSATLCPDERFFAAVEKTDGCWFRRGKIDKDYGRFKVGGSLVAAHRYSYALANGPIPNGLTVDHLCFNPICVRPDHLRLLTHLENSRNQRRRLKTHCIHGHELTAENTGWQRNRHNPASPYLHRFCRECRRASDRRRKARQ